MMKQLIFLGALLLAGNTMAQSTYKAKKKKKDFFGGARDYRDFRSTGFQFQLGPSYTFTRSTNETEKSDPASLGNRFQYVQDPAGRLGVFGEIGLAHFITKDPFFKFGRFVDYIDYGIGFKLNGGKETTTFDNLDALGNVVTTTTGEGKFYHGSVYARFAIHKLHYLKGGKYFFDHSIGLNADYRVLGGDESNYDGYYIAETQRFAKPLAVQLHYDLGFGIKLKRGSYLIPGVQLPVLGIQQWHNGGNPSFQWYSNNYYPVYFKIKFIKLLVKKSNGCNPGSKEDKERNEKYMQSQ
jgi:hypothetical protein